MEQLRNTITQAGDVCSAVYINITAGFSIFLYRLKHNPECISSFCKSSIFLKNNRSLGTLVNSLSLEFICVFLFCSVYIMSLYSRECVIRLSLRNRFGNIVR